MKTSHCKLFLGTMSVNTVAVLAIWAVSSNVASANSCVISDCSIANSASTCSLKLFDNIWRRLQYYPLEQNEPHIDDSEHLFNIMYNHQERSCIKLEIYVDINYWSWFKLDVRCLSSLTIQTFGINFEPKFHQAKNLSCIKYNEMFILNGEPCDTSAGEKLRLTFLDNGDQLLLEDLSGKVSNGTSLLLQKTDAVSEGRPSCECPSVKKFFDKKKNCANRYEIAALESLKAKSDENKKFSSKQNRNYSKGSIVGTVFGFFILVVILGLI